MDSVGAWAAGCPEMATVDVHAAVDVDVNIDVDVAVAVGVVV